MRTDITHHHDGHGLNDETVIEADDRDPKCGNASHNYYIKVPNPRTSRPSGLDTQCFIHFQHGARNEPESIPGALDGAVLAILIDRYEGFQAGKHACPENEEVLDHLTAAMACMKARADARAAQRVLGTDQTHVSPLSEKTT